jgi:TM2 domain-containing membrane protein YozV
MRRIKYYLLFLSMGYSAFAQDVYDCKHLLEFANHLYTNKEYSSAINEYKHALFLGGCNTSCQVKLFNAYLISKQYNDGISAFKSIYPKGLAYNDTIEMQYGKMLIFNANYDEVDSLLNRSLVLSPDQRYFLNISSDLFSERWERAGQKSLNRIQNQQADPFRLIIQQTENQKYKNPYLSVMLSAVIPGSGKMYSGYWIDGFLTLTTIGITAWQAYRGFAIYGINRPYSWIFASLSASFYISNLYGSFKAANMKNYNLRQNIHHACEEVFNSVYSY